MLAGDHPFRLNRALEARRQALIDYYRALRENKGIDLLEPLGRRCRETDRELNEAMKPFIRSET